MRTTLLRPAALLPFVFLVLGAAPVGASRLYGAVGAVEIVGQTVDPGSILLVDQNDGSGTFLGDPVAATDVGVVGLDFDSDGNLYGVTRESSSPSDLILIDADDGSLIQNVGTITASAVPISISDLAFQPGTDVLFGMSTGAGGEPCPSCLYTIDVTNAQATLVGDPGLNKASGVAFDAKTGTLYTTTTFTSPVLAILDPTDASVTSSESVVIDPPFDLEFGGFFDGLAVRPEDGILFATHGVGSSEIFVRNPQTQSWTVIGATGQAMSDLAFLPTPLPAFPAWVPLGTALLLGTAGAVAARRARSR